MVELLCTSCACLKVESRRPRTSRCLCSYALRGDHYALRENPRVVGGAALHPVQSSTTLRAREGETVVTDGPFADTKEVFGGWYLVEGADLDAAVEIAGRIPALRFGGAVEVRPVVEAPR
jgi:hypothetical protein